MAGILGVFGTAIPMTAIVSSLQYQSSGMTSLLLTIAPAVVVLMAHYSLPDESLNWRKSFGISLALSGAILLVIAGENGLPDITDASPLGYGLVFVSIFFSSLATIYIRKYLKEFDGFDIATVRMVVATFILMPLSLIFVGFDLSEVTQGGYVALIYAAIPGTFGGLLLALYNIQRFGATAGATMTYVIPIFAGLGGVLLLNETITSLMIVGMIIIISGIALIQERSQPQPKLVPSPAGD
jgi:drug/metabolite transporter (DMT)-like permease